MQNTPSVFNLPAVRYIRPDGMRDEGAITIPYDEEVATRSRQMQRLGIEVTLELMHGMVNVCLDDGEFDFKFELFPNGPKLVEGISSLVKNFDPEEYRQRRMEEVGHSVMSDLEAMARVTRAIYERDHGKGTFRSKYRLYGAPTSMELQQEENARRRYKEQLRGLDL